MCCDDSCNAAAMMENALGRKYCKKHQDMCGPGVCLPMRPIASASPAPDQTASQYQPSSACSSNAGAAAAASCPSGHVHTPSQQLSAVQGLVGEFAPLARDFCDRVEGRLKYGILPAVENILSGCTGSNSKALEAKHWLLQQKQTPLAKQYAQGLAVVMPSVTEDEHVVQEGYSRYAQALDHLGQSDGDKGETPQQVSALLKSKVAAAGGKDVLQHKEESMKTQEFCLLVFHTDGTAACKQAGQCLPSDAAGAPSPPPPAASAPALGGAPASPSAAAVSAARTRNSGRHPPACSTPAFAQPQPAATPAGPSSRDIGSASLDGTMETTTSEPAMLLAVVYVTIVPEDLAAGPGYGRGELAGIHFVDTTGHNGAVPGIPGVVRAAVLQLLLYAVPMALGAARADVHPWPQPVSS